MMRERTMPENDGGEGDMNPGAAEPILRLGLKWTEIDDHNDWNQAQKLIDEFEN